ncbi:MAG: kinase/pyrophosphorylase [Alphaproteobacteria bacterium]|nr:kinase/pyrophosphorylase [Alphaproteobacteria bacterium]OJU55481.1 MAG: phosphoenolpyruvate synthase regulatory protein [Alphaproteobacteria bacterium 62-8]
MNPPVFHIHLVSDATGETLNAIAKAALAQFEDVRVEEHAYTLVRSPRQLARAIEHIGESPGLVFFTLVNPDLQRELISQCTRMDVPCLDVMAGPVAALRAFLGVAESHRPGGQHEVDQRYLHRIEALNFTIQHDDGQGLDGLENAQVVLVGASRTSKTPTCVYLAIRGIRAANVPIVPGVPLPQAVKAAKRPLVVGLWAAPDRLVQVRRNRLNTLGEVRDTSYADLEQVRDEVTATRRLFEQMGWPTIDVSRRSVEETSAAILNLLGDRRVSV